MKFVTATYETQGNRVNDFQFCFEGEIVFPGLVCSRGSVDDSCGCRRSLGGLLTRKAGTTFKVNELPDHHKEKLIHLIMVSEKDAGWPGTEEMAQARVEQVDELLEEFLPGDIVEFRDGEFVGRIDVRFS